MDPLFALALAADAIRIANALLNGYVATRGALAAADAATHAARLAELGKSNAELAAKVNLELAAAAAKGGVAAAGLVAPTPALSPS